LLTKDPEQRPSIQELIKVPIIKNALEALIQEFEGKVSIELRNSLNDKDSAFKSVLHRSLEDRVSYSIEHLSELPYTISKINLPKES
jgi:hypothetical protein